MNQIKYLYLIVHNGQWLNGVQYNIKKSLLFILIKIIHALKYFFLRRIMFKQLYTILSEIVSIQLVYGQPII